MLFRFILEMLRFAGRICFFLQEAGMYFEEQHFS